MLDIAMATRLFSGELGFSPYLSARLPCLTDFHLPMRLP